eukprot:CAMPEP_0172537238 /NCGR_PEP_ID=MMETSP1067-20121228/8870_1 /TAXON_ID=265564 ORGANISM="Thalassiosira punctigera, Strain Tpunct2005C2" /NCGR_SAMPLE_ID=MMETSP1067 /ASSEMBLY_ACC=CAM_ASM_000444 /LENGTH=36 /DNA_ID= /DNA_START= /DNA_END= /DNA_ORIENTATION=
MSSKNGVDWGQPSIAINANGAVPATSLASGGRRGME